MAPTEPEADSDTSTESDTDIQEDSGGPGRPRKGLDPGEAWRMYEQEDMSYSAIASETDLSKSTVRRRVKEYESGRSGALDEAGREELESALEDTLSDEDTFRCDECGATIEYLQSKCGNCGTVFDWGAV